MRSVYSFILFFIFSLTVFGQNIEMHLCNGSVTDVSLFSNANCCCLTMVKDACGNEAHVKDQVGEEFLGKSCCENIKQSAIEEVVAPNANAQHKNLATFINVRAQNFVFVHINEAQRTKGYLNYRSPNITANPQTLFQCFRI